MPPVVEVPVTVVEPKYPEFAAILLAASVLPVILVTVVEASVEDPKIARFVALIEESVVDPRIFNVPVAIIFPWIDVP